MSKIKNIIIFVSIAVAFVLVYIFFIKPAISKNDTAPLVSSTPSSQSANTVTTGSGVPTTAGDFLTLLLSVKNIKLDDAIFSDPAFASLDGSHSIILTPDGSEGRPNPFAQFDAPVPSLPSPSGEVPTAPALKLPATPAAGR